MRNTVYPSTELAAMQEARNYYRAIVCWFRPHLGKRIVEIGAGLGTFSSYLLSHASDADLVLVEPSDNLFPLLQQQFAGVPRVRLVHGSAADLQDSEAADSVILVNVLEHIEEDTLTLQKIHRLLAPDGKILLFVPALPGLYGALDEEFGHVRRYTKSSLTEKLEASGFRPVCVRYWNLPGVASWFVAGKLLKRRTLTAHWVRLYDRLVVPWTCLLERVWPPPAGQSLIAVARKQVPSS
ncbi:MAG: class I SAM-dependent methyltransferase [Acidobacteriia bacterium]|nr:class I SAM-dependent methyltransferase [Terriglobia bacterium]